MAENFLAEAWSELAIALIFICLRFYWRISHVGWRKIEWDDILMVCAGLVYACETTAAHFVGAVWLGLANNNITPEGRATLDPNSQEWKFRENGSKTHVIGWFTYTALMWLLKCCWVIYYSRLTDGLRKMDVRIKMAWILVASTYVAAICMIFFKCWPLHRQWQINPDPGNQCQPGYSKLQVSFIMALNTITDIFLMAIPLPIIWKARLDTKRKISLMILFSGGWIVIIFGILRCVTLVTVGATEPSESGQWSVRESFVAVLVSNAPMTFPLFKRWFHNVTGLTSSGNKSNLAQNYPLKSNPQKSGSQSQSRSKNTRNYLHPLSVPNDTAWGSDEAIMTVNSVDKKDGMVKSLDKSSKESLDMLRAEVGLTNPQNTSNVTSNAGLSGDATKLNNVVITQEWGVTEAYEQDGGKKQEKKVSSSQPWS